MTRVFAIPALIAVLTLSGLLSALLIDGIGAVLSWIALGLPVCIMGWYVGRFLMGRG